MNSPESIFIAHVRKKDGAIQSVGEHLNGTAALCSLFSSVIGLPLCGRLLGLLHDLGKYSAAFQNYIRNITGINGEDAKLHAEKHSRGSVDHATAGAQYIWDARNSNRLPTFSAQIFSVAIMSHHSRSGLKDFIDLSGNSRFLERLALADERTNKQESIRNAEPQILAEIDKLIDSPALVEEIKTSITRIKQATPHLIPCYNAYALLARYLFSCLLDADRINTSDFENPATERFRTCNSTPNWNLLVERFESSNATFKQDTEINKIRAKISDECHAAALREENLFTLEVPTGGGKTLASLRFALQRAASSKTHRVDRIIYILPYTSILDQNAEEARKILGPDAVLEHHSNLSEERDTWRNRVLSENWDSPVVFTTSVQFLDALFAAGTKTARRMHQLSNAILIFDEIQTLPVKTVHLFNNAINFLCQQGNTTTVLCTATMPLLQNVAKSFGALPITEKNSLIQNRATFVQKLKRTTILNRCRPEKWSDAEIADYAQKLQQDHKSLLIICNTKSSARSLFDLLRCTPDTSVFHLSTNMCPAHRRRIINQIKAKLDINNPQPVICVSTQLIEAGVDLDFGCVIRALAGLDSIIQAAGRCNRHGIRNMGFVHILNFKEEKLSPSLKEIEQSQEITLRVFREFHNNPSLFSHDLLSSEAINRYYKYHFYQRAKEMVYLCKSGEGDPPLARSCSLLDLLSQNVTSKDKAERINSTTRRLYLRQAFSTAAQAFKVISAPTQGIIVPYDQDGHIGSKLIGDLAASYTNENVTLADQVRLNKKAQQYTVNVFPNVIRELEKNGAIRELQSGEGIYFLDERYYHNDLGITLDAISKQHLLQV